MLFPISYFFLESEVVSLFFELQCIRILIKYLLSAHDLTHVGPLFRPYFCPWLCCFLMCREWFLLILNKLTAYFPMDLRASWLYLTVLALTFSWCMECSSHLDFPAPCSHCPSSPAQHPHLCTHLTRDQWKLRSEGKGATPHCSFSQQALYKNALCWALFQVLERERAMCNSNQDDFSDDVC